MISKINHIGIIVENLEESMKRYQSLLDLKVKEVETVNIDNVINKVAFFPVGDVNIELVQTTADRGIAADFLRERGEGIHHIAFEVNNIEEVFEKLRSNGVEFVWGKIIPGSRGTKVAVIKPEAFNGVYIELVEKSGIKTNEEIISLGVAKNASFSEGCISIIKVK